MAWVDDLAAVGITVRLVDGRETRVLVHLDDVDVALDAGASVVVSELRCSPDPALDDTDRSYLEHEVLAAWSVLLHSVRARVVNRPSATHLLVRRGGPESRRLARRLGVPTVADHVASADDLRRLRAEGVDAACIDLSRGRPFWLSSPYVLEEGQLYLRVALTERRYGLVTTAGSRWRGWTWSPGWGVDPAPAVAATGMVATARVVFAALGLEYGFTFFSIEGGAPRFLRVVTSTPPDLPSHVVGLVATDLVASITDPADGTDERRVAASAGCR